MQSLSTVLLSKRGPEPTVNHASSNTSPHNTKLPPSCQGGSGCASALLHCKDACTKMMIPSYSKHRVVPCLNQFKLCSHLSDSGTKLQISLLALFIPSFQAPVFMSRLQSLQLLLPKLPLQSKLQNPLSSSTIPAD